MKEYLAYIHRKSKLITDTLSFGHLEVIEATSAESALQKANQLAASWTEKDKHFEYKVVDIKTV